MSDRPVIRPFLALGMAISINLVFLIALPMLIRGLPRAGEMTEPIAIDLVRIRHKEPPPPEQEEEPLEEEPPARAPERIEPELRPLSMRSLAFDGLAMKVDMALMEAPSVGIDMVYEASQVDRPPVALVPMNPTYPYQAKKFGINGYVKVRFLIDDSGVVGEIEIVESSPDGIFEESVQRALLNSRFRPGTVSGHPVTTRVVQLIRFDLK